MRTFAHLTTPHPAPNDTRIDQAPTGTTARAAVGNTDARSSRAASANPRHGRRSCSATAVLCGRLRFALASDPRYQRTTRCEPRHARATLRASLHTPHHTTLAKRPAALAKASDCARQSAHCVRQAPARRDSRAQPAESR